MPREEEERVGPIRAMPVGAGAVGPSRRRIEVMIAAPVPGNSVISDAWLEVGGARVTTIAVGAQFTIKCSYTAINLGGGFWAACITAIGVTDPTVKNFDIAAFNQWTSFGGTTMTGTNKALSTMGVNVMPAGTGTFQLRLKMWMSDNSTITTAPDSTLW